MCHSVSLLNAPVHPNISLSECYLSCVTAFLFHFFAGGLFVSTIYCFFFGGDPKFRASSFFWSSGSFPSIQ